MILSIDYNMYSNVLILISFNVGNDLNRRTPSVHDHELYLLFQLLGQVLFLFPSVESRGRGEGNKLKSTLPPTKLAP